MRATTKLVWYCGLALLCVRSWPQDVRPSAQERLTKAKQLYTQEGPKAALPEFEEALKMFQANKDRHSEAIVLGYIANCQETGKPRQGSGVRAASAAHERGAWRSRRDRQDPQPAWLD